MSEKRDGVTSEPAARYGQQHAEQRDKLLAEYEANAGRDERQDDEHKDANET